MLAGPEKTLQRTGKVTNRFAREQTGDAMSAVRALLRRIVDYAGLFPPARLDTLSAVKNYQKYLGGDDGWMLGSFVVPGPGLAEFTSAFEVACCYEQEAPWVLSVVCTGIPEEGPAFEEIQEGAVLIGSVEAKAADAHGVEAVLRRLAEPQVGVRVRYVEFPLETTAEVLPVLAKHGARAKIRMGGANPSNPDAPVPPVEEVAEFLLACAKQRVAWKATAGLHHAVRGVRELVPDGQRIAMHGFMNLFLAGALAYFGADEEAVVKTLSEEDAGAFRVDDDVIHWHDNTLITDQIEKVRSEFAIGFGSCSFEEPAEDLKSMQWI
jgi:hypothetical protein